MIKRLLPLLLLGNSLCASPIAVKSFERQADGMSFAMEPGVMKLQLFGPGLVRVTYANEASLPALSSFAVIAKPEPVDFQVLSSSSEVSLVTAQLKVNVDLKSGALGFYDAAGKELLVEQQGGGKLLERGKSQQSFEMQPGEAAYGLGQHQDGIMNQMGSHVHLQQENTKVAVPVLVSSNGYGLFWDNPAITEVDLGMGGEEPIPALQLLSEKGKPGGLTLRYYAGVNFDKLAFTGQDASLNFQWLDKGPAGLGHEDFSARWDGFVKASEAGDYTFFATADDGVRLWIDGQLVVDQWKEESAQTYSVKTHFAAGSRHALKLEYFQAKGDAVARLGWNRPSAQTKFVTWKSESAKAIDYYFMAGPQADAILAKYRYLTGAAPLMPKWAWGFWQSKERYASQQELLEVVDHYRSLNIPIDGIIQDWRYWDPQPWGSHALDPSRYPDPDKLMQGLHERNVHAIISVWPRFDVGSANAKELAEAGALYPKAVDYDDGKTKSHWIDQFNPKARAMYWKQISKELFSHGWDGWWMDASEPEIPGYWDYQTAQGPVAALGNAYPLLHTGAVYDGQRAQKPGQRVFILTRSAWAGQQRHSAVTWSGDIQGTWDVFAKQIPAGINFSLSGIPYWNTDIGGFFGGDPADPAYAELFTRWFQFGAFCPMFRVHGTSHPKEMWRFDDATQKVLADFDRLRYHLLPYIYSVSWKVTHEGYSLLRGLVMDFREDPKALNIADEFMFGPDLLVAPVIQAKAVSRSVYLPAGTGWFDFWTGKAYAGGQEIQAAAPIESMPLFVKAGSILPYGPEVQHAAEAGGVTELRIYPGSDASFTLYEDDGVSNAYEKGGYATVTATWNDASRTLALGARQGSFAGLQPKRRFSVSLAAAGLASSAKTDAMLDYSGKALSVSFNKQ